MREKRPVYNGYTEKYLTGEQLKQEFKNSYLLTQHYQTTMTLDIPTYLELVGIEDEKTYRVFIKDGLCKIMRADTDGSIDYFGYDRVEDLQHKNVLREPGADTYNTICPECGSKMKLKRSRYGVFIGCSAYPKCKYKENIPVLANEWFGR